jgi:hypothetical protein
MYGYVVANAANWGYGASGAADSMGTCSGGSAQDIDDFFV